ncbi:TMEM165/GDT1 family protein [Salininema proteolyticum]|uniref:GDT1 family protein n=1 Tax=Salininema proteolyticum TaxID=1607685 RepID=A0ABV8TX48_9ACTN
MTTGILTAVAASFPLVFIGEFGDKSQLMAMSFATRYRKSTVVAGILIATSILFGLSVAVGASLGSFLPTDWIALVAGLVFVAFGLWTLRPEGEEEEDAKVKYGTSGLLTVVGAIVLAEMGDKTMLAAITLSAKENPIGVWVGAVVGMSLADILAVFAGAWIAKRVSEKAIRYGSAALFIVIGVIMAIQGVRELTG